MEFIAKIDEKKKKQTITVSISIIGYTWDSSGRNGNWLNGEVVIRAIK